MLAYLTPVQMVEFVMKFHQASSVIAHQGGVDQLVLLVRMHLLVTDPLGWKGWYSLLDNIMFCGCEV